MSEYMFGNMLNIYLLNTNIRSLIESWPSQSINITYLELEVEYGLGIFPGNLLSRYSY